jgi:hypothetical protein
MLELDMASLLSDLHPTIGLQGRNDILRIHTYLYTLIPVLSSVQIHTLTAAAGRVLLPGDKT